MWLVEVALRDFIQLEPGILRALVEQFSWLQFVVLQKTVKWCESPANMCKTVNTFHSLMKSGLVAPWMPWFVVWLCCCESLPRSRHDANGTAFAFDTPGEDDPRWSQKPSTGGQSSCHIFREQRNRYRYVNK